MRCQQVETRLNDLIDQGISLDADSELRAHCEACTACGGLLQGYARLAYQYSGLEPSPPLSEDFSVRVVDAWRAEMGAAATRETAWSSRAIAQTLLAIAATLLLAVLPWARWNTGPGEQFTGFSRSRPDLLRVTSRLESWEVSSERNYEIVWRTTGRGLVVIPQRVRLATRLAPGEPMAAAIRPVVTALETLRRVLISDEEPQLPVRKETGLWQPDLSITIV